MSDWNRDDLVPPPPAPAGQDYAWGAATVTDAAQAADPAQVTDAARPMGPALELPADPTYPRIPAGPSLPEAVEAPRAPRLFVVALVAALAGALAGGGAALVATTDLRRDQPEERSAGLEPEPAQGRDVRTQPIESRGESDRVSAVAERVLPSVVQIDVGGGGLGGGAEGNGSGVVYRSDGYIVTNNHVVASGRDLEVILPDGTRLPARVVGTDPDNDLAVLKVARTNLPAIAIGDSSALKVGELAVAVGSPFGLESTVTAGVISALNRPIQVSGADGRPVVLPNVIQTDAAINPGNSGGALVNGEAELVGINSAILTAGTAANAGVGFAIPSNTVVDIADELIEQGFVEHAYLGVAGLNVTPEVAERLGVDSGAFLQTVDPDAPAYQAGLRTGDVIVRFGDQEITSMDQLVIAVRNADVGQTVEVTYIRDGERATAQVTLTEKPR